MLFVYFSLLLVIWIGKINSNKTSFISLIFSIFASNVVFFIITNFGVWVMQVGFYDKTLSGLMYCYTVAIPFLNNSLFYTYLYLYPGL